MEFSLITTGDGSHSLYSSELNEGYHSIHGAAAESLHIFIESGFNKVIENRKNIHLLEIGFGTGLNAFLTRFFSEEKDIHTLYYGIETAPVLPEIYSQLNYPVIFNKTDQKYFLDLHSAEWNTSTVISENFTLYKQFISISNAVLFPSFFDLIYFDAFAPQFQPEIWEPEIFEKIYQAMKKNAVLVTYCCNGKVKRTLKSVGFSIEKLSGPKGKREILRAQK